MDKVEALAKLAEIKKQSRLYQYSPYDWQKEFHAAGIDNPERMLCAANRVGKTYSASHEVAFHATGEYPDYWTGKVFDKPTLVWAGGVTNEALRDIVQKELLGGLGEDLGTGSIPKKLIKGVTKRQCGIGDVADTATVLHKTGGQTKIVFKSYEQGWKKWQGTAPDVIWLDEEPEYKIYTECQTRILTSRGILLVTFTPLSGLTQMVLHFREGKPGTYVKNVTWDDVPHISEEDKARLLAALPDYEREARSKGIPMMGQGRIFPIDEEKIKCKPFKIPDHFFQIIGIDFGDDHPNATTKIAWDRDQDIIYVVHSEKMRRRKAVDHALKIKSMGGDIHGGRIPVAWPHDGENSRDGEKRKYLYLPHGVTFLSDSARYDDETGGAQPQEPIIQEIFERMESGRFKVFETNTTWFEEFRNYHRIAVTTSTTEQSKIVSKMDDELKATFYAVMSKRYAIPRYMARSQTQNIGSYLS